MDNGLLKDAETFMSDDRRARLALERRFKGNISGTGLTLGQYTFLAVLGRLGESTMGVLAKEMGLTLGGLTGLVDRVMRMGLLERFRIPQDRRIVKVKLTDKGHDTLKAILDHDRRHVAECLSEVTKEDREAFLRVFKLLVDRNCEAIEMLAESGVGD